MFHPFRRNGWEGELKITEWDFKLNPKVGKIVSRQEANKLYSHDI